MPSHLVEEAVRLPAPVFLNLLADLINRLPEHDGFLLIEKDTATEIQEILRRKALEINL